MRVFRQMEASGIEPDVVAHNAAITACAKVSVQDSACGWCRTRGMVVGVRTELLHTPVAYRIIAATSILAARLAESLCFVLLACLSAMPGNYRAATGRRPGRCSSA